MQHSISQFIQTQECKSKNSKSNKENNNNYYYYNYNYNSNNKELASWEAVSSLGQEKSKKAKGYAYAFK